jgi:antirestriction protein ArdC
MTKTAKEITAEIDDKVTQTIIDLLEKGGMLPWQKPWTGGGSLMFPIRENGQPYQGINVILLWIAAEAAGYTSNQWMGFHTAKGLGGKVRKGEKGTMVVYYSSFVPKKEAAAAKAENRDPEKFFMKKTSYVWNVCQIDDLPEKYRPAPEPELTEADKVKRIDEAEAFFKRVGADVQHGKTKNCFIPSKDQIHMMDLERFKDAVSYYATLGHEHIHWTGAEKRLNRPLSTKFGSDAYAAEELVAEMGSAFLCCRLGISPVVREDHAQYIAGWLEVLKNDKKYVMQAASLAQKAVKFLSGEIEVKEAEVEKEAA